MHHLPDPPCYKHFTKFLHHVESRKRETLNFYLEIVKIVPRYNKIKRNGFKLIASIYSPIIVDGEIANKYQAKAIYVREIKMSVKL